MIAFRLPPEIEAHLDTQGRRTGQSARDDARDAILDYLEDRADLLIAERRLADLKAGKSDSVPLSELLTRYAL
ncbi:CopG family transcriptional regulator [Methylobacterium sp. 10]|uniref:type II toxin-antitoxin system RelB family antitoxin n=1 Tax=Methylobacterium sp. 10 TaxID=1101191 RepID=UPI00056D3E58|nr:CopG family transcriptional regulator [Methylobacterium sp. 10]